MFARVDTLPSYHIQTMGKLLAPSSEPPEAR
jgi:hypothetical protein